MFLENAVDWNNVVEWLKFGGITLAYGILAGLAAIVLFYAVLCIVGFTCCGILAGSCAACCHSSIGDVEAGSCFACCQSAGAGGMTILNPLLFVVGFALTVTLLILDKFNEGPSEDTTNSTMTTFLTTSTFLANATRVFNLTDL